MHERQGNEKIRVLASNFKECEPYLKSLCPPHMEISECSVAEYKDIPPGDERFIIAFGVKLTSSLLDQFPKLKMVQLLSAGTELIDKEDAKKRSIIVSDNGGSNADTVADHSIMLILSLLRMQQHAHNNVINDKWQSDAMRISCLSELYEKTVGIIGYGRIGKRVAKRFKGFDTRILAYDINKEAFDNSDVEEVSFEEILSQSEIISLHVPLTELTKGFINQESISLMAKRPLLVNTCRGEVLDTNSAIEAIKEKRLSGLALDVFENEPNVDPRLKHLDNIILSPHRAGSSVESWKRRVEYAFECIDKLI